MILSNPWRRPYFLRFFTWAYIAWAVVPLVILVAFSFNRGVSRTYWQGGPSLQWYVGLPDASLFNNSELIHAFEQTVLLAVITTLFAVPLGIGFAIGMDRWHGRTRAGRAVSTSADALMVLAFLTPELVLGVAFYFAVVKLLRFIPAGTAAQSIALIVMTMPYPAIIVRARLLTIRRDLEEVATDLGATPNQALRLALLPRLYPAVIASTALVLARVINDLVVVRALSFSAGSETINMKIYGGFRTSPSPVYNALTAVLLAVSMVIGVIAYGVYRLVGRVGR